MSSEIVGEHMVKFPVMAGPTATVGEAYSLMKSLKIRHLPIIEKERVVGIVSERDLRGHLNDERERQVGEIMIKEPFCVRIGTSLDQVLEAMDTRRIGSAVVISGDSKVLGIFTTIDAIKLLRRMLKHDPFSDFAELEIDDVFEAWDNMGDLTRL